MLTVLSVIMLYFVGWTVQELDNTFPRIIWFFVLIIVNLQYGIVSYNAKYDQWGDRLLWGISFALLVYAYLFNWETYMWVIEGNEDYKLIFGVTIILATPVLAVIGPFKLVFDHFLGDDSDELDDEYEQ